MALKGLFSIHKSVWEQTHLTTAKEKKYENRNIERTRTN